MFSVYLVFIGLMGIYTFFMYYVDKRKAVKGARRISEKCLLLSSLFGGGIGGLIAMYTIRHKTKHWYFVLINVFAFVLYVFGIYLIYKYFGTTGFTINKI